MFYMEYVNGCWLGLSLMFRNNIENYTQGRSHQNLSGQVEIILQGSTSNDFQIIVIVVHSMHSIL